MSRGKPVKSAINIDYEGLKGGLVRRGRLEKGLLAKNSLRQWETNLRRIRKIVSPYEPLLYDIWVDELATSLDRILSYRREARELEVAAVKTAADYELFCKQNPIELKIDILRLRAAVKNLQMQTQKDVANSFGKATSEPLAEGFETNASLAARDIDAEIASCVIEQQLLEEKSAQAQAYQDAFFDRTNQDGNAHNYAQRASILWSLIYDDVVDSYLKSISIARGIELIYGIAPSLPDLSSAQLIDDMVVWCRRVIRSLSLTKQTEVDFDIILPLVQPISDPNSGVLPPMSASDFKQARLAATNGKPAVFKFRIDADALGGISVRLRGIGASYGNKVKQLDSGADRNATTDSYARYRVTIGTPAQGGSMPYNRPDIRLGMVSIHGGTAPICYSDGLECRNLNPLGAWKLTLDANPTYKDDKSQEISSGINGEEMLDIKLMLRLRTVGTFKFV